jgi:hypothetical protein
VCAEAGEKKSFAFSRNWISVMKKNPGSKNMAEK